MNMPLSSHGWASIDLGNAGRRTSGPWGQDQNAGQRVDMRERRGRVKHPQRRLSKGGEREMPISWRENRIYSSVRVRLASLAVRRAPLDCPHNMA